MVTSNVSGPGQISFEFDGLVAIVTGSSKGIGYCIADLLAKSGASVVINGRDEAAVAVAVNNISRLGSSVIGYPGDLRSSNNAAMMAATTVEKFGRIDILINNAGGNFYSPLRELSANGWRAVVETNLSTAFHAARACYPSLAQRRGGCVVNIGSVAATAAHPGRAAYAAAKAGLASLTKTMAFEWARDNIRVNCIEPGAICTEDSRFADETFGAAVAAHVPLNRLGTPRDIADACLFLCSEGASFITGSILRVDGGPTLALAGDESFGS